MIAAEDDYGVTRVQLFRSLNGSRALPLALPTETPPERRHEFAVSLPLARRRATGGRHQAVRTRGRQRSGRCQGFGKPCGRRADHCRRRTRTADPHKRRGASVAAELSGSPAADRICYNEEIEQLKKRLEKRDPEGALSDDERESLEKLADRIAEQAEAVRKSAEQTLSYDIDHALNDELQELAKRMQEAADETRQAAEAPDPQAGPERALGPARSERKLASERKEKPRIDLRPVLDKLAEIYPADHEDQARFTELAHQQRDLAERLASLKEQDNPDDPTAKSRMRDLEAEQRRNREDLDRLLNDIPMRPRAGCPDDDPGNYDRIGQKKLWTFAAALCAGTKAGRAHPDAETSLSEFSGTKGHTSATDAADVLESFLSKCQGMGDQAGEACQGLKFKPGDGAAGETLDQMLADAGMKLGSKPGSKPGQTGMMGAGGGFCTASCGSGTFGMLTEKCPPRTIPNLSPRSRRRRSVADDRGQLSGRRRRAGDQQARSPRTMAGLGRWRILGPRPLPRSRRAIFSTHCR